MKKIAERCGWSIEKWHLCEICLNRKSEVYKELNTREEIEREKKIRTVIQFTDVLGNTIQLKMAIDTFRQVEEKPCWIVESREIFPQLTEWSRFHLYENQYFESVEEAYDAIILHVSEYAEKAKKLGENIKVEKVVL